MHLRLQALLHAGMTTTLAHMIVMSVCLCVCVYMTSQHMGGRWMAPGPVEGYCWSLSKEKEKRLLLQWQSQCQEESL